MYVGVLLLTFTSILLRLVTLSQKRNLFCLCRQKRFTVIAYTISECVIIISVSCGKSGFEG